MCLAISKPAGAIIPVEHLKAGHVGNPHGCGFVYSENGKLTIVKGLFTFEEFYKQYKEKEHLPMLIHFRFSTHGKPNVTNCHPFSILDGKFALIHNGVIKIHTSIPHLSDTGNFSKLVMEPMLKAGIEPEKPAFRWLVETAIEDGNKVCLMDSNGNVTIYNEEAGTTENAVDKDGNELMVKYEDGSEDNLKVWYSHGGYKYCRRRGKKKIEDEYEGFFDCGEGEQAVSEEEAALIEQAAQQIDGESALGARAQLDPPPNPQKVVEGFKAGVRQAQNPADEVLKAYDAVNHRSPGRYPAANGSSTFSPEEVKEITSGPIFAPTTELEIAFLQDKFNMSRGEAIHDLQLEMKDAISYV